eukprot:1139810-Pelagomonas_calceolata.AAC.2
MPALAARNDVNVAPPSSPAFQWELLYLFSLLKCAGGSTLPSKARQTHRNHGYPAEKVVCGSLHHDLHQFFPEPLQICVRGSALETSQLSLPVPSWPTNSALE